MPERPYRPFTWALAAVLAVAVAVPAVAQDAPPSRRVPTAVPSLLTCGGLPFAPAALDRRRGYERRSGPLARALRRFLRRKASAVGQPRRGWFLLARDGNRAEVAAGRGPYGLMGFVLRRGRWQWEGSGRCRLRTYEDGMSAVTWRRKDRESPLPPETTRIPVLVQEEDCASGRDASGRVLSPRVHYGRRAVTVTYFLQGLDGSQSCPSNPPTRATLVLDEPLAGRKLRDGGPYPARPRR